MLKTNPRTGTISLFQKSQRKSFGRRPNTQHNEQTSRKLIVVRTEEERTQKQREEAFQAELMSLGLFGEPQEVPTITSPEPLISQEPEVIIVPEVTIPEVEETLISEELFVGPPESPKKSVVLGKKRGRKPRK